MRLTSPDHRAWLGVTRFLLASAISAIAAFAASPAAAAPPARIEYTYATDVVLTDVCSFPIDVVLSQTVSQINFYDQSGLLTRIFAHVVEQDTFTANGNTLVGLPFVFNVQVIYDDEGNWVHNYSNGLVEKIPLPDGSLFVSAGRLDWVQHPLAVFILSPDKGNPGNSAGFCAALAD
jgi:hypothetical protein